MVGGGRGGGGGGGGWGVGVVGRGCLGVGVGVVGGGGGGGAGGYNAGYHHDDNCYYRNNAIALGVAHPYNPHSSIKPEP